MSQRNLVLIFITVCAVLIAIGIALSIILQNNENIPTFSEQSIPLNATQQIQHTQQWLTFQALGDEATPTIYVEPTETEESR